MRVCPQCHSVFPEDYVFCLNDGTTLNDPGEEQETVINNKFRMPASTVAMPSEMPAVCASCGMANQPNSKFCKKCGTPFLSVSPVNQSVAGSPPPTGFPAFEVQLNENPQNNANPSPAFGETVALPLPYPAGASQPPVNPVDPVNPNRNMLLAVAGFSVILLAVIGFSIYSQNDKSANSSKNTASKSGSSSSSSSSSSAANGPAANLPKSFERSYQGTIGGQDCLMTLKRNDDELNGTAATRKTDSLYGKIDDDGDFEMSGYENDNRLTGIYKGRIHPDGSISGTWTTPQGTKSTSFTLSEQ